MKPCVSFLGTRVGCLFFACCMPDIYIWGFASLNSERNGTHYARYLPMDDGLSHHVNKAKWFYMKQKIPSQYFVTTFIHVNRRPKGFVFNDELVCLSFKCI